MPNYNQKKDNRNIAWQAAPLWWAKAVEQLLKRDPMLAILVRKFSDSFLTRRSSPFEVLVNSIVGQQISVKAADKIKKRLKEMATITPKNMLDKEMSQLRMVGLSRQKVSYIQNVARWFQKKKVDADWFEKHASEEIAQELLAIKGIGRWTLQMFQIFYLQESNILPVNDLGLIKAVEQAYHLDRETAIQTLPKIANEKWCPYSTAAVWFLWRSLDPEEINY